MKLENWFLKRIKNPIIFLHSFIKDIGGIGIFLKKTLDVLWAEGINSAISKSHHILFHAQKTGKISISKRNYNKWLKVHQNILHNDADSLHLIIEDFQKKPTISIILPVENENITWLKEAINSVKLQVYPHWELCIAANDSISKACKILLQGFSELDHRIKINFRKDNINISIASTCALTMATGEWVAIYCQTDLIAKDALFWIVNAINQNKTAKLFYSDQDQIDKNGRRQNPYFKCNWNYHLFLSQNLIGNLAIYHAKELKEVHCNKTSDKFIWDYELALRFVEKVSPDEIIHIPRLLYHSRINALNESLDGRKHYIISNSNEKIINEHLSRTGVSGTTEILENGVCRVKYKLDSNLPLVSLIIPTKNSKTILENCIKSISEQTDYPNYEILIIDNNSDDTDTLMYFELLKKKQNIKILFDKNEFNFSAINNNAVKVAEGSYVCFLNDDTEVISSNWLSEMISICTQPNIGVVGARLWYPNNTLQHGGVILGVSGIASHAHRYLPKGNEGYHGRAELIQEFSAVSAACMVLPKSLFVEVGGFNENQLAVAYNDVDLCLKIKSLGYSIIWTPFAELYHYESASRGNDIAPEKNQRLQAEASYMYKKWGTIINNDPAYSPNLTREKEDFSLAWPPRLHI